MGNPSRGFEIDATKRFVKSKINEFKPSLVGLKHHFEIRSQRKLLLI